MINAAFNLILIAALLACPLRCSASSCCSAEESNVQSSVLSGCDCCLTDGFPSDCFPTESEGQDGELPLQCPDEDCNGNCSSCICNGVVLESENDLRSSLTYHCLFEFFPVTLNIATPTAFFHADFGHSLKRPEFLSGRDARISIQSLLI